MWQIMKAELHYNRWLLIGALAAVMLISVPGVSQLEHMDWMIWLPFFLVFENLNKTFLREKRNYMLTRLPLPIRKVGSTRVALQYLLYLSVGLFWFPLFMQSDHVTNPNDTWLLIATSLLVVNVFTASTIKQNLNASRPGGKKRFWIYAAAFAALVIAFFSVLIVYNGEANPPAWAAFFLAYPVMPVFCALPLPALYYVAIRSYSDRETYFDGRTRVCG